MRPLLDDDETTRESNSPRVAAIDYSPDRRFEILDRVPSSREDQAKKENWTTETSVEKLTQMKRRQRRRRRRRGKRKTNVDEMEETEEESNPSSSENSPFSSSSFRRRFVLFPWSTGRCTTESPLAAEDASRAGRRKRAETVSDDTAVSEY